MKIGMILDNEFTGDMRVENEVISLVEAGHQVFVLCFNYGKKEPFESFHGGQIIRILINSKYKDKMKGLTNTFFDPYTRYWGKQISSFVKEYNIEVLHVHDLVLLGGAFKGIKKLGYKIPVVSDLHENYPEALKYYKFSNTFPGNILISVPKWERTEIKWIDQADYIITVIEEAVTRYEKLGTDKSKITVVANYVNSDEFLNAETVDSILEKFKGQFVISYLGGFDSHRGLESVIRAVPLVRDQIPNFKLVLVGAGRNLEDLKQLAKSLDVEEQVVFEGWQLPSTLPTYISASSLCLIPHLKTGHTDNTIPHKLFQYMLLGKPVLSTNCNPLERIINETKSGLIFRSNDEKDLAEKIKYAYDNSDETKQMGVNGTKAVKEIYNWENTAKNLINLYKKIEDKKLQ
ncbi:MAG: glycosyltransferase family 4 protein [Saprospiraceae bacterium]